MMSDDPDDGTNNNISPVGVVLIPAETASNDDNNTILEGKKKTIS